MSQGSNSHGSELVIFDVDASKAKPRKITDPVELARIRKLLADLERYGYIKPRGGNSKPADSAPPGPDATSPPTPS